MIIRSIFHNELGIIDIIVLLTLRVLTSMLRTVNTNTVFYIEKQTSTPI